MSSSPERSKVARVSPAGSPEEDFEHLVTIGRKFLLPLFYAACFLGCFGLAWHVNGCSCDAQNNSSNYPSNRDWK